METDLAKHRSSLPQLGGDFFMTDGGIETTLISLEGQALPHFAAFPLLQTADGRSVLRKYFRTYAELARRFHIGLVLESATWRANPDWGERLGYGTEALAEANMRAVSLIEEIRSEYETPETPIVISGCVGPRLDGYVADRAMSDKDAEDYHRPQIETFAETAADVVTAITMSYAAEAVGLVRAAKQADMPVVISFTVETDGRLPSGQSLEDEIKQVDDATSNYPAYFMINCAHPSHFDEVVGGGGPWVERIRGLRANASRRSHAEMDEVELTRFRGQVSA
jgi:S-methylmethionine-dependent homocysteine/selenocysteine methylase